MWGYIMGNAHNSERLSEAFTASQGDHSGDKRTLSREDGKNTAYIWIFPGSDRALLLFYFYESHWGRGSWSPHWGGLVSNLGGNLLLSCGIDVVILPESLALTGEWCGTVIPWKLNVSIERDVCCASQSATGQPARVWWRDAVCSSVCCLQPLVLCKAAEERCFSKALV